MLTALLNSSAVSASLQSLYNWIELLKNESAELDEEMN